MEAMDDQRELARQVGKKIREARKQRGMTQEQLAAQISDSCSGKMISQYESGISDMRMLTYFGICEVLGCYPNDLAPANVLRGQGTINEFFLLNEENRQMIEKMIQALLLQQSQGTFKQKSEL